MEGSKEWVKRVLDKKGVELHLHPNAVEYFYTLREADWFLSSLRHCSLTRWDPYEYLQSIEVPSNPPDGFSKEYVDYRILRSYLFDRNWESLSVHNAICVLLNIPPLFPIPEDMRLVRIHWPIS